ncbi:hypothetical protein Tco_0062336, partial [Tanacetum coccineum]
MLHRSWFVSFCWACSHGSKTVLPDVSHRPSFVIMLVSAVVASQGAVSQHLCLGMAAAEQLQPRRLFDIVAIEDTWDKKVGVRQDTRVIWVTRDNPSVSVTRYLAWLPL